jgi:hypothetical protein
VRHKDEGKSATAWHGDDQDFFTLCLRACESLQACSTGAETILLCRKSQTRQLNSLQSEWTGFFPRCFNTQPIDAVALSLEDERLHAERAKQRQRNANPQGINQYSTEEDFRSFEQKSKTEERIHAREIAAETAGVSETMFHRGKTVLERADPELVQRVREGQTSIKSDWSGRRRLTEVTFFF